MSQGAFPSSGHAAGDNASMRLAELFGRIAEVRAELRSLFGADPETLERVRRDLNRIEAEASLLRAESSMPVRRSGH